MLVNIMDLRERPYRWANILAVAQSAAKDNDAEDADQVRIESGIDIDYAERENVTLRDAVLWAERLGAPVTLYLYDADGERPEP